MNGIYTVDYKFDAVPEIFEQLIASPEGQKVIGPALIMVPRGTIHSEIGNGPRKGEFMVAYGDGNPDEKHWFRVIQSDVIPTSVFVAIYVEKPAPATTVEGEDVAPEVTE